MAQGPPTIAPSATRPGPADPAVPMALWPRLPWILSEREVGGAGGGEEPLSEDFLIHPVLPRTIHKGTLCLEPSSVHPGPMCVHTCAYTHTHTHTDFHLPPGITFSRLFPSSRCDGCLRRAPVCFPPPHPSRWAASLRALDPLLIPSGCFPGFLCAQFPARPGHGEDTSVLVAAAE